MVARTRRTAKPVGQVSDGFRPVGMGLRPTKFNEKRWDRRFRLSWTRLRSRAYKAFSKVLSARTRARKVMKIVFESKRHSRSSTGTGVGEAARVFDRGPIRKNKCGCLASEPRGRAERVMVTESFGPVLCRFGLKGTGTRRWKQRWKRQQSPAVFWRESTFTRRCWR